MDRHDRTDTAGQGISPCIGATLYARVRMLDLPYHTDRPFDYIIPSRLTEKVRPGVFALVPFGARRAVCLVTSVETRTDVPRTKLRELVCLFSDRITLSRDDLALCGYISSHTFCTMGEAARSLLPPGAVEHFRDGRGVAQTTSVSLARPRGEIEAYLDDARRRRSPRQDAVLHMLLAEGTMTDTALRAALSLKSLPLVPLAERGLISLIKTDRHLAPSGAESPSPPDENILTDEQQAAFEKLCSLTDGKPRAALLYGVTGSGKTRVIKAMADAVLAKGRRVLILIPEIALTPQTIGYFRSCYGDRIAVMHSSLSDGERLDAYLRMKSGGADICIGTRSAVFAPLADIGMIVIDEEQEHTYKSDRDPKYHARDVAAFRCGQSGALLLLASATPSLESWHKAQSGVYTFVELKNRYGDARLPSVTISDMRREAREGRFATIGFELEEALRSTLTRGEQAILLLNRRGYNHFVSCPQCGEAIRCPRCSVSLTYHAARGARRGEDGRPSGGYLSCHYCGWRQAVPEKCPSCGKSHLSFVGFGIQKAEDELRERFPNIRILRMDADTTTSRFAFDNIIESFRRGDADVLLGTQMVTKGHDFPNVTLSGVLSADMTLYLDDYRAPERAFALLTQVIGRAGRADKPGQAIIQTMNPEHPVIGMAAAQDYRTFYEGEIKLRRAMVFPPYCDIVLFTLTGTEEAAVADAADAFAAALKAAVEAAPPDAAMQLFGPLEAPVYRVDGKYRLRIVAKCRLNAACREIIASVMRSAGASGRGATVSADAKANNI